MTTHRFLTSCALVEGAECRLDEAQARQIQTVLRLRAGDHIVVFDGAGAEAEGILDSVEKRSATCKLVSVSRPEREPSIDVTVGLALLRGDRFEVAVQKLTEIGVRRIVPLEAERCVLSFRDARDWEKRAARYRRIIVEALEQSERVTDVELYAPCSPEAFMQRQPTLALRERGSLTQLGDVPLHAQMAVAVGPEGGWSDRELATIDDFATAVSLGGLILRAETAAIVAAATLIQRSLSLH